LKSESEVGENQLCSSVGENAGGNDTVPISVWRGGGMCSKLSAVAVLGCLPCSLCYCGRCDLE